MLQQYVNRELPDVQDGFRKGRKTRDQIANICWIIEKSRKFQKKSTSASLTMLKPLAVWITTNCGIFFIQVSQEADNMIWYSNLLKNFPQFAVIHTVKGFGVVNEAEVDFFWNSLAFLMIQWILAI